MLSREFLLERGHCCGHGCLMCPYEPKHTKGNTYRMDRKNILIVSALDTEVQGQLDDWKPHNLLITGVGKVNATHELTYRLLVDKSINYDSRINLVINYGTAGSQVDRYTIGDLVDCTRFIQRDMDVSGLGFKVGQTPFEEDIPIILQSESEFNPIGEKAFCGTGDSFVQSSTIGDIVDMEAYALAKVCYKFEVPFISFKYITDDADGSASNDWEKNVSKGIDKFKENVLCKL